MRIGQDAFYFRAATFNAAVRPTPDNAGRFDMKLSDQGAAGSKPTDLTFGQPKDPVQNANEAIAQEFLEWAHKTPAEKVRERILESKGLDEESLKALPETERKAIENEIRQALKQFFGVEAYAEVAAEASAGSSSGEPMSIQV